ncbi:MAG: DUF2683 family protein [Thermoplasmata archaeon]|nr:DUF2683 family protein [Thermoplasmata archaeon]
MVQAVINLEEHENRIINVVKGKFGLKNKSEAISLIINEYERELLEPELKPEYIEKMKKREKEPTVKVKDFGKHFGLN